MTGTLGPSVELCVFTPLVELIPGGFSDSVSEPSGRHNVQDEVLCSGVKPIAWRSLSPLRSGDGVQGVTLLTA